MFQLRPYQQQAVNEIRQSYQKGFKAPLFVLPTGGGKTICFTYIAANAAAKGKRVLILVHRIELIRQTAAKLRESGCRVGLINPRYSPDPGALIQVASVQTMTKRLRLYPHFDLIITDEAHHIVSKTYLSIIYNYPGAYQLGVTATPIRSDGKGLGVAAGGVFDFMVLGPTVQQLIELGSLVRPVVYAPKHQLDFSDVRTSMGDYDKKQIAAKVDKPKITGNAVRHYRDLCSGQPAVVFCISVEHAGHVALEFQQAGYRAESVDGSMGDDERQRILNGLGNGSVEVVCSCDLISEGTDIPAIACAILLRPTKSTGLFLQQVGRALRPVPGKTRAIILDHVGNVIYHGLPDADRDWSLEGIEKRKRGKKDEEKLIQVHQCTGCYAVFSARLRECPECGKPRDIEARKIEQTDGELVELTAIHKAQINAQKRQEVGRAKTLEELEAIAESRGYKPGWAKHVFNSRPQPVEN